MTSAPQDPYPNNDALTLRRTRLRQILALVGCAVAIAAVPYLLAGHWKVTAYLGFLLAALAGCGWLEHRGRQEQASIILVLSIFLIAGAMAWSSEGLRDVAIFIFPAALVIAALLVGTRTYLVLLALILAFILALWLATDWGLRKDEPTSSNQAFSRDMLIVLSVIGMTVWLIFKDIQKLLRGLHRQIAKLEAAKRELAHISQHDGLTGLPNRIMGAGRITQAIRQAERNGNRLALLFVDIDNFKSVNDTMGHAAGDELLKTISQRLAGCIRHSDIVCRQGGDEFIIGLTELDAAASAAEVAEDIMAELNRPMILDGHEFRTTGSIGIAIYPDDATDYEELASLADIAMYQAKESGRNLVCFFEAEMNKTSQESRRLVPEIRRAIAHGEFHLLYQPVFELETSRLVGVEALVRWNHPKRGELSPAFFIPAAEKSGLIVDLGEWVLREACAQMARWRQQGHLELTMAVNLSAVQFLRGNVETMIETILAESGVPAHCLELEITESALIRDPEQFIATLDRLKHLGVALAIDDFGTGYSNFAYLPRLKIDRLKVDRSFIAKLLDTQEDLSIVTAIIQVARAYNLQTTAEGIEDRGAIAQLLSLGCDLGQGFHFSRPIAADEIGRMMSSYEEQPSPDFSNPWRWHGGKNGDTADGG